MNMINSNNCQWFYNNSQLCVDLTSSKMDLPTQTCFVCLISWERVTRNVLGFFLLFFFSKQADKSGHLLTSVTLWVLNTTQFVLKFVILKSKNFYK